MEKLRKAIAPKTSASDMERLQNAPASSADAQIACGLYLASEYLERCSAFEAAAPKKKAEP
jgi:hypothetical protein